MTSVTAIVLAYREEPWLERSVLALLRSRGVEVDVVVVDNGSTDGGVEKVAGLAGVTLVQPGRNLGFAGGCNEGVRKATGDVLAFVNGDAVVEPEALGHLARVALLPDVGIATGSIRLSDDPDLLNSGGNDIHFLGFSWSGRFGTPARDVPSGEVTAASGAGMAMRREVWDRMGGFEEAYFAYHEDAELSLRCWQRGLRVVYVPEAVVIHRYEFSRNAEKHYLVERNRLMLVLTLFEGRTLVLLTPLLLSMEALTFAAAVLGGWAPQKLAGWAWLVRRRRWLRERRGVLQSQRIVPDRELADRFAGRVEPGNYPLPRALRPLNSALAGYWFVVRRLL